MLVDFGLLDAGNGAPPGKRLGDLLRRAGREVGSHAAFFHDRLGGHQANHGVDHLGLGHGLDFLSPEGDLACGAGVFQGLLGRLDRNRDGVSGKGVFAFDGHQVIDMPSQLELQVVQGSQGFAVDRS